MKDIEKNSRIAKEIKDSDNKYNLFFIFTIDKTNYDRGEISWDLLMNDVNDVNYKIISKNEYKDNKKKNQIIHLLYDFTFSSDLKKNNSHLQIKLSKNLNWIKSQQIHIPKKKFFFFI